MGSSLLPAAMYTRAFSAFDGICLKIQRSAYQSEGLTIT